MSRYSPVFKRDLVQKVLARKDKKIDDVAKEHNVSRATLFRWLKQYVTDPQGMEMRAIRPQDWSAAAKTKALLETRFMNEQELGVYLRSQGLYHCHLKEWQDEVMGIMGRNRKLNQMKNNVEDSLLRQRIKDLQRELKRKDKALKEATALLALKKKAELIWGSKRKKNRHRRPKTMHRARRRSQTKRMSGRRGVPRFCN